MRKIALPIAACLILVAPAYLNWSSPAFATCKSEAIGKDGRPLAGAALKSHMASCTKKANADCAKDSADKKLAGAAKKSHMTKCVADAVGQ
jgi:hypothetical protein